MSGPILELVGVGVRLGETSVLDGIDLSIAPGEIVLLAGRNGAGKTTLLRVAAGLVTPSAGSARIAGHDMAKLGRRAVARQVALVPQDTQVPFPYAVSELVLMGRAPHLGLLGFEAAADRDRVAAALARLGIAELAERSILELSGGERQLVSIARALVQDTPLLLLDEPTAHLDVARRLELQTLLRELAAEGRSIVLVSHDLGAAAASADRLALLAEGRILATGAPAEVLTPDRLRTAFGVEARWLETEAGALLVPGSS